MQEQQQFIGQLKEKNETQSKRVGELEKMIVQLQMKIIELNRTSVAVKQDPQSEPEIKIKEKIGDEYIITTPDITDNISKSTPQFMVEDD